MDEFDEIDMEVLRLLLENACRPFSDIADAVDLSAPAVSNRIDRPCEAGVIRRFTLAIDRSQLRGGVSVLVTVDVHAEALEGVREVLREAGAVEQPFTTADSRLVFHATVPTEDGCEYDVSSLAEAEWALEIGTMGFALSCAECGNTVTSEGPTARISRTRYHFCCPSCEVRFEERYTEHAEAAD